MDQFSINLVELTPNQEVVFDNLSAGNYYFTGLDQMDAILMVKKFSLVLMNLKNYYLITITMMLPAQMQMMALYK